MNRFQALSQVRVINQKQKTNEKVYSSSALEHPLSSNVC